MGPLRRLAGIGRLPDALRAELVAEGMVHLAEGRPGSVATWSRPGVLADFEGTVLSLAVTHRRVVVWGLRMRQVDLPLPGPWPAGITAVADRADRLVIARDFGAADPARHDAHRVRVRVTDAAHVLGLLGGGRILDPLRGRLVAEGLAFLAEDVRATITHAGHRVAGVPADRPDETADAAVAVTPARLVVWVGRRKFVDVPRVGGRPSGIDLVATPGRILLSFDAGTFRAGRAGRCTVDVATDRAAELAALLSPTAS